MKSLERFGPASRASDVLNALDRDGGVILEDVITPEAAQTIIDELRPYVEISASGADDFPGRQTSRTGALVARSQKVREVIMHPRVLAMADGILLRNCERYRVMLTQLVRLMPGQPAQPHHRDRWIYGPYLPNRIEPQLGSIWALTDFTFENGATQVVPGSSTWPNDRTAGPDEIAYATMKRGSVLVYTGTVFHGGGANVTADQERWGMLLNYCLGWIRQEEEQFLSCPPEIARTLKPELRTLLGYETGQYGLGYYTPPVLPGRAPDFASPNFAVGGDGVLEQMGEAYLAAAKAQKEERESV